ncbi:hypothetical protein ALC57_02544, partial [Trachymyrmex cornetzi]
LNVVEAKVKSKKHYDKKINPQKFKPGDHVFLLIKRAKTANLTTLSLINIDECDIPPQNVNSSNVYVQLLQLNDFNSVKVIQCKVEIDRTVNKCGMLSHFLDVHNGQFSYIADVTQDACRHMHTYGNKRTIAVYSISTPSMIFSLTRTGTYDACGYTLIRTEHPKLLIVETSPDGEIFKSSGFISVNIDMFSYINSKFVYVERHIRTQINQLYRNILLQQCQLAILCLKGIYHEHQIHGYALHTVYGWSVYLLGGVWDSLTQHLLHLGRNKPMDENPSAPDLEMQKHNETETKLESIYPLLPPREETAYTFELKD